MTRQDVENVFARRDQAIKRRDAVTLASLHSENGVLESPTAGGIVHGRRAIEDVYRKWFAAFPDALFTADEPPLIDGNRVAQRFTMSGTDTGGFLGLPATGKAFRMPLVTLFEFNDREIAHKRRIYDFTGLLIQIGVLKAKPVS